MTGKKRGTRSEHHQSAIYICVNAPQEHPNEKNRAHHSSLLASNVLTSYQRSPRAIVASQACFTASCILLWIVFFQDDLEGCGGLSQLIFTALWQRIALHGGLEESHLK